MRELTEEEVKRVSGGLGSLLTFVNAVVDKAVPFNILINLPSIIKLGK